MLRSLPTALLRHTALPPRLRATLAAIAPGELGKYQVEAVGQLLEMLIRAQVPEWANYFKVPADGLCAGRALTTDLLREEYGFTASEIEAGRTDVATAGPARLLALYFHTSTARRTRQTARLLAAAEQVSRNTNTPIVQASQLAA